MDINEIINCAETLSKMLGFCIGDKKQLKKNLATKIEVVAPNLENIILLATIKRHNKKRYCDTP